MRLYADYSLDNRQGVGIEIYVLGSFFFKFPNSDATFKVIQ